MFSTPESNQGNPKYTPDGNIVQNSCIILRQGEELDPVTEQHHREAVAVENILEKYRQTGVITHTSAHEATYGDFINATGYIDAVKAVAQANTMFESLPAHIRKDMDNDPSKFLDFIANPENRAAILEYGLSDAHLGPDDTNYVDQVPKYPDAPKSQQAAPREQPEAPAVTAPEE